MKERISHWQTTVPSLVILVGALVLRALDKIGDELLYTLIGVSGAGMMFKPKAKNNAQ